MKKILKNEQMFIIFASNKCSKYYMARLKRIRKVLDPPKIKGFKPYGPDFMEDGKAPETLLYEEYEALRLCDYDMCNHAEAAIIMNVSRPTFTRIYASLRRKLAQAFIDGRSIVIEGGKVYFDTDWYHCFVCQCDFNTPAKDKKVEFCPLCGSQYFENHHPETETTTVTEGLYDEIMACPECGSSVIKYLGTRGNHIKCSVCGFVLSRKAGQHGGYQIIEI